jgi:hypothetical protein
LWRHWIVTVSGGASIAVYFAQTAYHWSKGTEASKAAEELVEQSVRKLHERWSNFKLTFEKPLAPKVVFVRSWMDEAGHTFKG